MVLTFIFFISIIEIILTQKQNKIYKCGVGHYKIKPPLPGKEISINYTNPLHRRRLPDVDSDGFKQFNIYLDNENLKEEIKTYKLENHQDTIINCLEKAANTLMSLLKVKFLNKDYILTDSQLKDYDINYWENEKFGDEAKNKGISLLSLGIDLVIFSRFENYGTGDTTTLATAGPMYIDNDSHQPYSGKVNINPEIDFSKKGIEEYLSSVLTHELTHVLGFGEDFFQFFKFNSVKEDKYGISRIYLNSPKVIEVAKKYFNCDDIDGVELENDGGQGTTGSHWEARILLGEYMCGTARNEEQVISEFTLAYLEDTGYYKANYYTGGLMRYGKNKGCSFIKDKCVNNYEIKPEFENEFFDSLYYQYDPSCSSGRLGRTYNYFSTYADELPTNYQYFQDKKTGGYAPADYCPVSQQIANEIQLNYFSGSCSELGDGTYGSLISYDEEWDEGNTHYKGTKYYNNSYLEQITGEKYSDHSFCFLSSLIKKTEEKYDVYVKKTRSICIESFCSSKSLTVKIHENYIVCPRAGGKIELDDYGGYLLCPDYNLICTGTIICNNMFDCVEKKSEIKNDTYNYDYTIKTSQNIEDADAGTSDSETNYELSEDGQCPIDCKQCLENKKCIKCRDDYEFVGTKNEETITCVNKDELKTGYYKDGSLYYKCTDYCETCENDEKCTKCVKDYYLLNDDVKKCYSINEITPIKEYYLDENNITYYSCGDTNFNSIENCKECDKKDSCSLCKDGYTFMDGDKSKCVEISGIGGNYIIDPNDSSNYIKCSVFVDKCSTCNSLMCLTCDEGYIFINDDFKNCLSKSSLDLSNYYSNDGKTYYSCENDTYKSNPECTKLKETQITNPKTLVSNPQTITSSIPKTIITIPKTTIANLKTTIANLKTTIANPTTIITIPKTTIANPTTIITIPKTTVANPTTIITIPKTTVANPTTIITIPKTTIANPTTILTKSTTTIKTTELKNQTVYIETPLNIITIYVLQVKLRDYQLYLYVLLDSYVSNSYSLKIKIIVYNIRSLRNLQAQREMEINISPLNNTNSNGYGGLYTFVSDQSFKEYLESQGENTRIVVTNVTPNINYINNNKYEYYVKMADNSDYLDTSKMDQMLQNNQAPDLGQVKNVNIYHLDSISQGCSFDVTTNETINIPSRTFNLEFQDIKSHNNITSTCSSRQNSNIIKCNMDEVIFNSSYILNDYIDYNNNEVFSIISDKEKSFPMSCFFKYNKSNNKSSGLSKGMLALVIIIPIIAAIIIAAIVIYCYNRLRPKEIISQPYPSEGSLAPNSTIDNLNK